MEAGGLDWKTSILCWNSYVHGPVQGDCGIRDAHCGEEATRALWSYIQGLPCSDVLCIVESNQGCRWQLVVTWNSRESEPNMEPNKLSGLTSMDWQS